MPKWAPTPFPHLPGFAGKYNNGAVEKAAEGHVGLGEDEVDASSSEKLLEEEFPDTPEVLLAQF